MKNPMQLCTKKNIKSNNQFEIVKELLFSVQKHVKPSSAQNKLHRTDCRCPSLTHIVLFFNNFLDRSSQNF